MSKSFDVVITTYNRPKIVVQFVESILSTALPPKNLIIVDSSDNDNIELRNDNRVVYMRSSVKSQPYQRYLGLKNCQSELITFFDDDLKILDGKLFNYLVAAFDNDKKVVGASVTCLIENSRNSGKKLTNFKNGLKRKIFWLFGYRFPKPGKISFFGYCGAFLKNKTQHVDYFYGDNMTFKRELALKLFDPVLFALFEKKLAMGEDKIISMRASLFGALVKIPKTCLYHPPLESSYLAGRKEFYRKIIFSRYFLSKEFAKVREISTFSWKSHYYWHVFWLFTISVLKLDLKRSTAIVEAMMLLFKQNEVKIVEGRNYEDKISQDILSSVMSKPV